MAREELMIRPRREVAGVVAREAAEELGRVVLSAVVDRESADELGLVVPARTTALMSPP